MNQTKRHFLVSLPASNQDGGNVNLKKLCSVLNPTNSHAVLGMFIPTVTRNWRIQQFRCEDVLNSTEKLYCFMTINSNGCQDISLKTTHTNIMESLEEKSSLNILCVFTKHYDNPSNSGWDFSGWTKTVDQSADVTIHTAKVLAWVMSLRRSLTINHEVCSWKCQWIFSPAALQPFSKRSEVNGP